MEYHVKVKGYGWMEALDPESCEALDWLCNEILAAGYELKICLSSSWRILHDLDWMKDHLKKYGFAHYEYLTARTGRADDRGEEIQNWLDHAAEENMSVDGMIIIDDDMFDIENYFQDQVRIETEFQQGFRMQHAREAFEKLGLGNV